MSFCTAHKVNGFIWRIVIPSSNDLTYANAEESQIRLQGLKTKEVYTITVPSHLINEIVKSYWADVVQVKAQKGVTGAIVLDEITKAA